MADGDQPSDWEALCKGDPPRRIVIRDVETVYADDRQYPGCLVLKVAGRKAAIVPRDNLLMLRRVDDEPPEDRGPARPSPLDLSRANRRDRG